jgi:hypothetical protein
MCGMQQYQGKEVQQLTNLNVKEGMEITKEET